MSVSSTSVGKLGYGAFYLPVFAYGYVATQSVRIVPITRQYLPWIPSFNETPLFIFLTAISLLGAIQTHGLARAIYGTDGPSANPKYGPVQIRHSLAIMLGVEPDRVPKVAVRVFHSGFLSEFVDYCQHLPERTHFEQDRREWKRQAGPLAEDPPRTHKFEVALRQLTDIPTLLSQESIFRLIYFIPTGVTTYLAKLSFLILSILLFVGHSSYIVFLLWMGHFVLLFRKKLWAPIPTTIYPEELSDIHEAEYRKQGQTGGSDRGRLDSEK